MIFSGDRIVSYTYNSTCGNSFRNYIDAVLFMKLHTCISSEESINANVVFGCSSNKQQYLIDILKYMGFKSTGNDVMSINNKLYNDLSQYFSIDDVNVLNSSYPLCSGILTSTSTNVGVNLSSDNGRYIPIWAIVLICIGGVFILFCFVMAFWTQYRLLTGKSKIMNKNGEITFHI